MLTIQLLTPPAMGAIATLQIVGENAWNLLKQLSEPLHGALPEVPPLHRVYLVKLAGDEVVLAVKHLEPVQVLEVHCHGGLRVIQAITELIVQHGGRSIATTEVQVPGVDARAIPPLSQAKTLRTANILLDQYHGAFQRTSLQELANWCWLGSRLVNGWKVVIGGAPNVGKSSLMNRLAGYDRAVVSPIAGTTRDVVTTTIALEGWPIELADTAGVRFSVHEIESEGIRRARLKLQEADLVLWLLDATSPEPGFPTEQERASTTQPWLFVWNKMDEAPDLPYRQPGELSLSAKTGEGLGQLVGAILQTLVPQVPEPGQGIPFTPELAEQILQLVHGNVNFTAP